VVGQRRQFIKSPQTQLLEKEGGRPIEECLSGTRSDTDFSNQTPPFERSKGALGVNAPDFGDLASRHRLAVSDHG
jgi:hypothetical protein